MDSSFAAVQQALELLIKEFENANFKSNRGIKNEESEENTISVGSVKIHFAKHNEGYKDKNFIEFESIIDNRTVFRGVLSYVPLLYTKENKKTREKILSKKSIRGVVCIQHSKNSFSRIAIIVLDKTDSTTWFANCNNVEEAAFLLMNERLDTIPLYQSDVVDPENLLPDHYSDSGKIPEALQNTRTSNLDDLAEIISGKSARSCDYRETGIPYLRARDIQNGKIVAGAVCLEPDMAASFSKQLLQEGDILLTKHFGQRKLALVKEENLPAIASEALYIIRPFGISEKYLYRYLTSKTGNEVFNSQLKKIERGATIISIAISDLRKIQVPIYDEETMMDIEQLESMTGVDGIEAALRIIQSTVMESEEVFEKRVYEELLAAGWEAEKLHRQREIMLPDGKRWIPDISYCLPDDTYVYFEVKKSLLIESADWATTIKTILQGSTKCYYILTTGYYYEVHISGSEKSLKMLHAPTINEITDWERGQN